MGVVERLGHAAEDRERALGRHRAGGDLLAQGVALDALHDDQDALVVGGDVVDHHYVRVVERRAEPRLAPEAPDHVVVSHPAVEALDRHAAPQPLVLREVHGRGAARSESPERAVAPSQKPVGGTHSHQLRLPEAGGPGNGA